MNLQNTAFFLLLMGLMLGCGEGNVPTKPTAGYLPDSLTDASNSEGKPTPQLGQDTLVIGKEKKLGASGGSFEDRNERLSSVVFEGYSKVELDPMEAFPNFKTTRKSAFLKLRKSKSTSTQAGPKVYPRLLLKSYEFSDPAHLRTEFEAWVNGLEHAGSNFELGKPMSAVKTPPILCFMTEKWLVMVQWSCQYQNAEWSILEKSFFDFGRKEGAIHLLAFSCEAGKVVYQ